MADSDLYNFEFLSIVAKITQEIENYTGLDDKALAEFVISLHDQSKTLAEFKGKLAPTSRSPSSRTLTVSSHLPPQTHEENTMESTCCR